MIINMDLMFVFNFLFTAFLLSAVALLWGEIVPVGRICLSAALGSGYVLFLFVFRDIPTVCMVAGHLLMALCMIRLLWARRVFRYILTLYGVAFFTGGSSIVLISFLPLSPFYAVWICLLTLYLVLLLGREVLRGLFLQWQGNKNCFNLRINFAAKVLEVRAYLDTGNVLKGPGGREVIILDWETFLHHYVDWDRRNELIRPLDLVDLDPGWPMEVTSFSTLGEIGLLILLRPDGMEVETTQGKVPLNHMVLGLAEGTFPLGCKALLPEGSKKLLL